MSTRGGRAFECLFDEEGHARLTRATDEANKVAHGRARSLCWARAGRRVAARTTAAGSHWGRRRGGRWGGGARPSDLLLLTGEARRADEETLALTVSPFRTNTHSPLAGLKTVNYLEHVLSWEEARSRDFDEGLVLNERGEVASAAMANVFWVKHGTVHTPALATGALAGTTRARVIELAEEMAVPLVEGVSDLHALADADEIFLTSAGSASRSSHLRLPPLPVPVGSVALRLREPSTVTLGAL